MVPNFLKFAYEHGWIVSSLEGLIAKDYIVGHLDGNHGNLYPRQEEFTDSGVKYISANAITGGQIDFSKAKFLSNERANKFKKGVAVNGDVIFAHNATVGPVAVLETTDEKVILSTSLTYYRTNKEKIDARYLSQFMSSSAFTRQYESIMRQTTRNQIPITTQREFLFAIPPLSEQKKIAQILSTWDKAITTTEQLLANSQQQKKALMQQLLTGKKRLLDKNGVRFCGEWKLSKLSKLFERVTTKNNGQSTNVVTISGQHGLIRQEDFFKKIVASETLDGYFLLKQGQFAYNKSYSNGYPMGAIKRLNDYPDGVVTTLYICFELSDSDRADSDFWEHYFESGLLNQGLSQIAHEGGRAHGLLNVKPSDFFSLKVPAPCFEEQRKIAAVLSTADQEISALQQKLDALKQEKKALMQQLLTGKRRVTIEKKEFLN